MFKEKHGDAGIRICEKEDCADPGEFRAPRSRLLDRGDAGDYQWLCLAHIREFNKSWNFFDGMSSAEVLRYKNEDITGHRPTWKLGARSAASAKETRFDDPFDLDRDAGFASGRDTGGSAEQGSSGPFADKQGRDALATLNLHAHCSLQEIKKRHRELVKKYHPDLNGGDKSAEEVLKNINQAYTHLLNCGNS